MNVHFFLLLTAALLFRYLASGAKEQFQTRLTRLLRRQIPRNRLAIALKDHPEQLAEFRSRMLPLAACQIALDLAACAALMLMIFVFPPAKVGSGDLAFLKSASVAVVGLALAFEVAWFLGVYRVAPAVARNE